MLAWLTLALCAYGQTALDDAAITKLVKAGISEPILVEMINQQPQNFRLSSDDVIALQKAGASDSILSAMLARKKAANQAAVTRATTPFALTLRDATPVRLSLTRELTFTNVKPGDKVDFEVMEDYRIDGMLVIGRGAIATAVMTMAEPKTRMGKGGKLGVSLSSIPLMNGDKVAIRPAREGRSGASSANPQGPTAVIRPDEPALLFTYSREETFPSGTKFTAYVDGETQLSAARFLVDMAFTSNPPGAMVSMYGAPLGRTPFTTKLAPGSYKATFSVAGYADITQSLSVGPGYSNVANAPFEMLR
jgi:PEGA domain-containing protein